MVIYLLMMAIVLLINQATCFIVILTSKIMFYSQGELTLPVATPQGAWGTLTPPKKKIMACVLRLDQTRRFQRKSGQKKNILFSTGIFTPFGP